MPILRSAFSLACLLALCGLFPFPLPRALAQADALSGSSEGRLVRNEEGFSLDLAGGFELGKYRDGYYLLGSRTVPGLILVKSLPGLTAAQLDRNFQAGYTDHTVRLTPDGVAEELATSGGAGKLVEVRGFLYEGEVRGLLAGYLRPDGGGLLLFAVTTPEQWPELSPIAGQVARSVSLFHPDPQELIKTWKERLSGFQLVHAPQQENRGGAADTQTGAYYLCGDGSFVYEHDAKGVSEPPADRATSQRSGSWDIVPQQRWAELVLRFRDGRKQSYRLSRNDLETYLDDQRYFVLSHERCP
jgi:hypothetical protein